MYSKPDILILDEPTSALDLKTQERIVKEIFRNNKDKTIVFVSHDKRNLIDCDKVYRLENKKINCYSLSLIMLKKEKIKFGKSSKDVDKIKSDFFFL